jgi:hypothetical protein
MAPKRGGKSSQSTTRARSQSRASHRSIPGSSEQEETIIGPEPVTEPASEPTIEPTTHGDITGVEGGSSATANVKELEKQLDVAKEDCATLTELAKRYKTERNEYAQRVIVAEENEAHTKAENERLNEKISILESDLDRQLRRFMLPNPQGSELELGTEVDNLKEENRRLTNEVAGLKQRLDERSLGEGLLRHERGDTVNTMTTDASVAASWRPRGLHPNKLLTGKDADEYGPWRYAIDEKLDTDAPMYPTDAKKVRYALSQMENPIFQHMQTYVADNRTLSFHDLMDEVEHFIGYHLQEREAKKALQTIKQQTNEGVSEYYHRIRALWQKAKVPEDERIDKFLTTMLPGIASTLLSKTFTTVREALDEARTVEDRRKDLFSNHPRLPRNKGLSTTATGKESTTPTGRAPRTTAEDTSRGSTPAKSTTSSHPNTKFDPVAKKPEGWVGNWHDPETNPKKLTTDEKSLLQRQGRCWSCRGSGHRSSDAVCPFMQSKKLLNNLAVELSDSEDGQAEN